MPLANVIKIVSGGQVGADRAGLDFALVNGIEHGGWCPRGRKAVDGVVPAKYQLKEAERTDYPYRTKLNVRDSDGTVIFTSDPPGRGSALTIQSCIDQGKPYEVITKNALIIEAAFHLLGFIRRNKIEVLNVAGSRAQDYYTWALMVLKAAAREAAERDWKAEPPDFEDPKMFLKSVKSGIGESRQVANAELIDFTDDQDLACTIKCHNAEHIYIIPASGRLRLNQGMARRLANTLERWVKAGNLGKGNGEDV